MHELMSSENRELLYHLAQFIIILIKFKSITIDMPLTQACYIYSPCIAHLGSHVLRDLE